MDNFIHPNILAKYYSSYSKQPQKDNACTVMVLLAHKPLHKHIVTSNWDVGSSAVQQDKEQMTSRLHQMNSTRVDMHGSNDPLRNHLMRDHPTWVDGGPTITDNMLCDYGLGIHKIEHCNLLLFCGFTTVFCWLQKIIGCYWIVDIFLGISVSGGY